MSEKKYIITVSRRCRDKDLEPMTIKELVDYFGYTLEKGRSWQHEKGNRNIPVKFTNIDKLIQALNDSESNASANGYSDVQYSLKLEVTESKNKEDLSMVKDVTSIVNNILGGKDITQSIMEAAGRLASVTIVDEPYGKGVEVRDTNGAVYRYAVDTNDPKYYTPEKVKNAVLGLAKRYNYDMGRIYNFLKNNTLGDYDKDVSGRAGLGSAEIVAEPNGEGLKITFDNGKVFRYTVDTNDENYDTLEKLKDGAEGMWRHGASVDGIISFLDNHALLYAREGRERFVRKQLAGCVLESKQVKLGWV